MADINRANRPLALRPTPAGTAAAKRRRRRRRQRAEAWAVGLSGLMGFVLILYAAAQYTGW